MKIELDNISQDLPGLSNLDTARLEMSLGRFEEQIEGLVNSNDTLKRLSNEHRAKYGFTHSSHLIPTKDSYPTHEVEQMRPQNDSFYHYTTDSRAPETEQDGLSSLYKKKIEMVEADQKINSYVDTSPDRHQGPYSDGHYMDSRQPNEEGQIISIVTQDTQHTQNTQKAREY